MKILLLFALTFIASANYARHRPYNGINYRGADHVQYVHSIPSNSNPSLSIHANTQRYSRLLQQPQGPGPNEPSIPRNEWSMREGHPYRHLSSTQPKVTIITGQDQRGHFGRMSPLNAYMTRKSMSSTESVIKAEQPEAQVESRLEDMKFLPKIEERSTFEKEPSGCL